MVSVERRLVCSWPAGGDPGDPICEPPGPYTTQPGAEGKFLWLTGAPGLGKSTTAQLLARTRGQTVMRVK